MVITEATAADIPRLHVLVEMSYRGESSTKGWTSETDILGGIRTTPELLTKEMNTPGGKFLKYLDDEGNINGCVYTLLVPAENRLYIGVLCVNPDIQSKGVGKQLMAAAEKVGLENGCTKATISVISRRVELVEWYERRGYKPTGEAKPFAVGGGVGDELVENLELKIMAKLLL